MIIARTSIKTAGLQIDPALNEFVDNELLPGTGIEASHFWKSLAAIVAELHPRNQTLLRTRDEMQCKLDAWFVEHRGNEMDSIAQERFLREIGYLVESGEPFEIRTDNVDAEIASIAGPQLVVPVNNARYAINAANARWGSLYDALYGTDAIGPVNASTTGGYDPQRGQLVFERVNEFLDLAIPLSVSWSDVTGFSLQNDDGKNSLCFHTESGTAELRQQDQFVAFSQADSQLSAIVFQHHSLHIELSIDPASPIGQQHRAGVSDVVMEAALTTIQDCEDSVCAVDADDKVTVYRNWLGLMKGDLEASFEKNGKSFQRVLRQDRSFTKPDGSKLMLPGRSLLLVRNVGMHMMTDAVIDGAGQPIEEGFLDAMVTTLAAVHDLAKQGGPRNSRCGSIYIVKPKQHGPDEVQLTVDLFSRIEKAFSLPENTIKIGIMDEERRTSVNLRECIRRAADRVVFINTGFLDRTGDEIHSLMESGPFVPKSEIKDATWLSAYETANVDAGLQCGFQNRAQIGKGMWAMPDRMAAMLENKAVHLAAGANTAWVPSPTAAVLHALHYHHVDVATTQEELSKRRSELMAGLLTPCLLDDRILSSAEIERELENNAQGILGYVVRWIDQGIGCSKVPDVHNVGLMEDRATLRISSQHVANWLHHGVVAKQQVIHVFQRMAGVVDQQNSVDPNYQCMAPKFDSNLAFQAALTLVLDGRDEPNGYTERVLAKFRREAKA